MASTPDSRRQWFKEVWTRAHEAIDGRRRRHVAHGLAAPARRHCGTAFKTLFQFERHSAIAEIAVERTVTGRHVLRMRRVKAGIGQALVVLRQPGRVRRHHDRQGPRRASSKGGTVSIF